MALTSSILPILSRPTSDGRHECLLCPHRCKLRDGQAGACMVRHGSPDGVVLNAYGKLTQAAVEPIEKKPIWHYRPGLRTLSTGGYGCNFFCDYCQNFMVSQRDRSKDARPFSPKDLVALAVDKKCPAICFTYNEPTIYYEYLLDIADICKRQNLDVILKTNAYIEQEPWEKLCPAIAAMNIDWKGTNDRYREVAKADDSVIFDRIHDAWALGVHVEVSVPVYHDSKIEEYQNFKDRISQYKNPSIPVHLLKIFPANKTGRCPVTSDILLIKLHAFLSKAIEFVYIANVFNEKISRSTICHSCGTKLIEREQADPIIHRETKCCPDCPILYEQQRAIIHDYCDGEARSSSTNL